MNTPPLSSIHFQFNLKTRTKFGVGEAARVGDYVKALGFKRVGIVLDGAIAEFAYTKEILANIQNASFDEVKIWKYTLKTEPDYALLETARSFFVNERKDPLPNCFIGIGGGSVLDMAKGLAILAVNQGPAINYRGFPENITPPLPMIAVPTTGGTGSEVTYNASFIDRDAKVKMGINSMLNFPTLAILDPKLLTTCPRSVAISSGMDALVHAVESYITRGANPITRMFAKEAFALLFNNLERAVMSPENLNFQANIQLGAYLAAISLFNAGSGIAQALSYPLGVYFNVPHGLAGAVFLPHAVGFNVTHGYNFEELYDTLNDANASLSTTEKNKAFMERCFALNETLEIPKTLGAFGIDENTIDILIKQVDTLEKNFAQNPIPYSLDEGKALLRRML